MKIYLPNQQGYKVSCYFLKHRLLPELISFIDMFKKVSLSLIFFIVLNVGFSQSNSEVIELSGDVMIQGDDTLDVVKVNIENLDVSNLLKIEFFEINGFTKELNSELTIDILSSAYLDEFGNLEIDVPLIYHEHVQVQFAIEIHYTGNVISQEETIIFFK